MDFQSAKSFGKLRLRAFQPYHQYYICQYSRYKTRISNAFNAVADPGFSWGGAPTPKMGLFFQLFAENCMKMKEFGPPGGGARPWRPPLDPPMQCYLCRHCWYKTHPYIPAHIFLNIQRIFNLQKVLESWDSGLFNHTINTIYVDTLGTRQGSLMHSMLSMLTLLIQFSHLIVLCIRCCVRATNTSVDSVDKHSIKCIACFDLHIDSVDKQDTLLNTQ